MRMARLSSIKLDLWPYNSPRNLEPTIAMVEHLHLSCISKHSGLFLAFSAANNLKLCQFDVKGAYLHGKLNETIYMVQPPGYNDQSGQSCLLIHSLYGLRFTQPRSDYC